MGVTAAQPRGRVLRQLLPALQVQFKNGFVGNGREADCGGRWLARRGRRAAVTTPAEDEAARVDGGSEHPGLSALAGESVGRGARWTPRPN